MAQLSSSHDTINRVSLVILGYQAIQGFRNVEIVLRRKASNRDWPVASFLAEAERFELWAANLGLFIVGHGSLDYRVRDAENLAKTLHRFLEDLIRSLHDGESPAILLSMMAATRTYERSNTVVHMCSRTAQEPLMDGPETDPALTVASDEEDDDSEIDILLDGIRDPISRLFKMSTKIRNSSTRVSSAKTVQLQKIDEETGVDFLEVIRKEDYDYVRSVFLEHRKNKARQEREQRAPPEEATTGDDQDEVWEPIRTVLLNDRTGTDSFLIGRIAQANLLRRRQFAHWAQHRSKLHHHTESALSTKAPEVNLGNAIGLGNSGDFTAAAFPDMSGLQPALAAARRGAVASVTTATNLDVARLEAMDERSTWTVSEYAPSSWQSSRDVVEFPSAPKPSPKTPFNEFFECPYCFTLCAREILADKAWKAHLIHDLRPYICTYEHCKIPTHLYESRRDWVQHENSAHRKVYRCLQHSDQVFTQLDGYKRHLADEHPELGSNEASVERIVQASESVLDVVDRPCPICMVTLDTVTGMEGHIALHLERFAQFSFPRSTTYANEFSNADSDRANGTVAGESRDDDVDSFIFDEVDEGGDKYERIQYSRTGSQGPNGLTEGAIQDFNKAVNMEQESTTSGPGSTSRYTVVTVQVTTTKILQYPVKVFDIALSPDNKYLAFTRGKAVDVINLSLQGFRSLGGHNSNCWAVAWSSDGSIATGDSDGQIKLWSARSFRCFRTIRAHRSTIKELSFSPDGQCLLSTSLGRSSRLWRLNGEQVNFQDEETHLRSIYVANYTPDGKRIVTGSDSSFRISEIGRSEGRLTSHDELGMITALTFTSNNALLVTGSLISWKGFISLWDLESGGLVRHIDRSGKMITALAMSRSGLLMASATVDHTIKIWKAEGWTVTNELEGHTHAINTILFSNDDAQMFSCSDDKTIRIWKLDITRKMEASTHSDRTAKWAADYYDRVG